MVYEKKTPLAAEEVLRAATAFFAERNPARSAFPEKSGADWAVFRGQGGEEIAITVRAREQGSWIRCSTLFFDQLVDRFLTTIPALEEKA